MLNDMLTIEKQCMRGKGFYLTVIGETQGRALYISKSGRFYVARGYSIWCSDNFGKSWQVDCSMRNGQWPGLAAKIGILSRLFRQYVSAFAILRDGTRIAVIRDGIYRAGPNDKEMERVFQIARGSRPLNITIDDRERVLFGEYGDFSAEDRQCIYVSEDRGKTFHVGYAFRVGDIRHIHNVIYDQFDDHYWVLVGDFDQQPGIGILSKDLCRLDWVGRSSQKFRAVGVLVEKDFLYYGTDSELVQNNIVRLDKRSGNICELKAVEGSSLYAARFGKVRLISTCVEPSQVNRSNLSTIYVNAEGDNNWYPTRSFEKDRLNPILFQFGTMVLPTSNYEKPIGMFSGQAVRGFHNKVLFVSFTS